MTKNENKDKLYDCNDCTAAVKIVEFNFRRIGRLIDSKKKKTKMLYAFIKTELLRIVTESKRFKKDIMLKSFIQIIFDCFNLRIFETWLL